jgi:hypothetical protein
MARMIEINLLDSKARIRESVYAPMLARITEATGETTRTAVIKTAISTLDLIVREMGKYENGELAIVVDEEIRARLALPVGIRRAPDQHPKKPARRVRGGRRRARAEEEPAH